MTVWAWPRAKSAVHRLAATLNVSRRFRKQEFPARYYIFSMGEAFRRGVTERMRNHSLVITGYVLVTLSHFFLVAPILWYFLFRQFQQTAHPGEGQEVG